MIPPKRSGVGEVQEVQEMEDEEEEEEEEVVPRSVKGYFSVKNPKTDRYKWLIGFWR